MFNKIKTFCVFINRLGGEEVISGNKSKLDVLLPFVDFIFGTEADALVGTCYFSTSKHYSY
jgi:hypothetical protein